MHDVLGFFLLVNSTPDLPYSGASKLLVCGGFYTLRPVLANVYLAFDGHGFRNF